jgi:hypothetical protein
MNMGSEFAIKDWSAFAAGLTSKPEWLAWASDPFLPRGDATPGLSEMAPMQRRRVDRLGRMALQVAWWCQQAEGDDIPLVFASRHGDLGRSYDMLCELARDEPLSPTHFSLSTHNAIAAQYGIARKLVGNCICVSAGTATAEAAVVEALGLLADGHEEVLIVVYDCPLPDGYARYADETEAAFAWSARLRRPSPGDVRIGLTSDEPGADSGSTTAGQLPHGLEVLRFLIGESSQLEHDENGRRWIWRRDA